MDHFRPPRDPDHDHDTDHGRDPDIDRSRHDRANRHG
jgi:hypothetical protein